MSWLLLQAELKLSRSAADLKMAAADYAVAKRKEEIALMEEAAARIATSQLAQQIGGAYTNTAKDRFKFTGQGTH